MFSPASACQGEAVTLRSVSSLRSQDTCIHSQGIGLGSVPRPMPSHRKSEPETQGLAARRKCQPASASVSQHCMPTPFPTNPSTPHSPTGGRGVWVGKGVRAPMAHAPELFKGMSDGQLSPSVTGIADLGGRGKCGSKRFRRWPTRFHLRFGKGNESDVF